MDGKQHTNKLFAYIETLKIGQGRYAGQNVVLLPWQKRFLKGAFKEDVSEAALTEAHSNGNSTFAGMLGAAAVTGPLAQPMGEVIVVASSFQQAFITHQHIVQFLKPWLEKDIPHLKTAN